MVSPTDQPLGRLVQFILGPWRDLRYTYLLSSLILALPLPALMLLSTFQTVPSSDRVVLVVPWTLFHLLLFPLARELYFRLTQPIRRGMDGLILWGPLFLGVILVKVLVYVFLLALAIPVGVVAFIYLSLRAHCGR